MTRRAAATHYGFLSVWPWFYLAPGTWDEASRTMPRIRSLSVTAARLSFLAPKFEATPRDAGSRWRNKEQPPVRGEAIQPQPRR